jgi:hypothetical protein
MLICAKDFVKSSIRDEKNFILLRHAFIVNCSFGDFVKFTSLSIIHSLFRGGLGYDMTLFYYNEISFFLTVVYFVIFIITLFSIISGQGERVSGEFETNRISYIVIGSVWPKVDHYIR